MTSRWLLGAVLALTLVAVPASAAYAQPPNDGSQDGTLVDALPFTDSVDTSEATLEDLEPDPPCAPVAATVWYQVVLPDDTPVLVDTAGSDYDTVVSVYQTGPAGEFLDVACNDDVDSLQARVSFLAGAEQTYLVQVGAFGEGPGGLLEISFASDPGGGGGSGRPSVIKGSFRGNHAVADWFLAQEDTFTETFVLVTDGSSRFGPGRPVNETTLDVFHFSEELDPATGSVTFTDLSAFTILGPNEFTMDRRLRHASLDVDVTLEGFRCVLDDEGDTCDFLTADVTVSVRWDGVGDLTRSQFIQRESGDDFRFMFHSRATGREAVADGSITGEVDLVSGPAEIAQLTRAGESFLEWFRAG